MRKKMNFRKNLIMKVIAFIMICGMTIGNVCVPIFAEEETEDLQDDSESNVKKPEGHQSDSKEDEKESGTSGKETEKEGSKKDEEETDSEKNTGDKFHKEEDKSQKDETGTDNDTENESQKDEDESDIDNDVEKEMYENTENETVSGNDIEKEDTEDRAENEEKQEEIDIIDVVVPSAYTLALNPYRLPVRTDGDQITTEQVISGMYGIVNKSSTDQIVTVSLIVEDGNAGELVFVDSAEEAENAGMNVYAIYLTAVPADEEQVLIDDEPVEKDVTGESLQNVRMMGAQEQAVVLHEGTNEIAFKLSKAVYDVETEEKSAEDNLEDSEGDTSESDENPGRLHYENTVLRGLASDGMGVTAYTFSGVMNPNASWEKLSGGVKLSVVYTYKTVDGDEEIVEGTGAMINID